MSNPQLAEGVKKGRILIVEDHPVFRQGIVQLIAAEGDLVVCGEAVDVQSAMELAERELPDIAVVDLTLKESSGLDLIQQMAARWPNLRILVLSMHDEAFYAERVFRAGARGYLTKSEPCTLVIEGIRQVLRGEIFVTERLAARMVDTMLSGPAGRVGQDGGRQSIHRLSDREFQVFTFIGQGVPTRQIAEKLHLSIKTIDAHRENIKDKLKLKNATELLKTAIQWVQFENLA